MSSEARTEEHVGEWKVTISADSLEELFVAMARVVARACGPTRGIGGAPQRVSIEARDMATLLADWANDLIGRSEISRRSYDDVRVERVSDERDHARIDAEIRGRAVRTWRSPLKAATYHDLGLTHDRDRWRATVLLDV